MASIVKSTTLRQVCAAASKRSFSSKLSTSSPSVTKISTTSLSQQTFPSAFAKNALPASMRVAAFHASSRKAILPPLPQVIQGTNNDAAIVPPTNASHGSYHWTFERILSAALIPLTIAPFAAGSLNPLTDALLCGTILIHSHIGFDAWIVDYAPRKRIPKTRAFLDWALRGATVLVGVGLYEFETNDVGVTEAIKRVWTA